MTTSELHLLLRRRLTSDGCYFAELGAAARNDQIHHALRTATTWGELRELLPAGEFDDLTRWFENGGDFTFDDSPDGEPASPEVSEVIGQFGPDYITRPEEPFSPYDLSDFSESDYPPFLELEQEHLLPSDFCVRFGKRMTGFTSGSWWEFPAERAAEMKSALEAIGYVITIEIDAPSAGRSDD